MGVTVTHGSGTDVIHQLNAAGSLVVSGGSLTLSAYSAASSLTVSGGTLTLNAPLTATSLTLSGGTLGGPGTLTLSGTSNWSGGVQSGTGITKVASGATFNLNSAATLALSGRTLNNAGTVVWTGSGSLELNDGAVWNNNSGGLFNAQNNATISASSGTGSFVNAGTFRKSSSTGTTSFGAAVTFTSSGTVDVQSGTLNLLAGTSSGSMSLSTGTTLDFSGGFTLTSSSSVTGTGSIVFSGGTTYIGGSMTASSVTVSSGATISGSATIAAAVTNSGTIHIGGPEAAGTLAITGNFTQTSSGVLNMEIGGLTAGTQYDRLSITGTAALGGTLNVTLISGFTPASGNAFQLITYTARSGTFGTFTGLQQGGVSFAEQYNSTNLTLVALAEVEDPDAEVPPLWDAGDVSVANRERLEQLPAADAWLVLPELGLPDLRAEDAVFIELAGQTSNGRVSGEEPLPEWAEFLPAVLAFCSLNFLADRKRTLRSTISKDRS
jgi:hypothetical protein